MLTPEMLRRRAAFFARIRAFFAERDVLEVDTPLIGDGLVVEAHIDPIPCSILGPGAQRSPRHLLTSPEGPMKRLLAAGSGPIYQLAHAFRDGEIGRRHAPEFTMLEWYRPGFDDHALMDEVEALVRHLLPDVASPRFLRTSYRQLFRNGVGVDPFAASIDDVRLACDRLAVPVPDSFAAGNLDDALDLLLVGHLEQGFGRGTPLFVTDYPASQAALAKLRTDPDGHPVAARFELYIDGVELANGYHELADADEQRRRFEVANQARLARGADALPIDEPLLRSLATGFPDCAGVALGVDRLLMVATKATDLGQVRMRPPE